MRSYAKQLIVTSFILASFVSNSQNRYNWNHIDNLLSEGYFTTARKEVERVCGKAQVDNDGYTSLIAAYYLSTIDYAYNKYPADSAIARFTTLTRRLKGTDCAIAYGILFQTYREVYLQEYYQLSRNKSSDDPKLVYHLWHRQRMEDTLTTIADSILAYGDLLRRTNPAAYQMMFRNDSLAPPPIDSTLLGAMAQNLLKPYPTQEFFMKMHKRVAKLYSDMPTKYALWFELERLYYMPSNNNSLAIIDSLYAHYRKLNVRDDLKASLASLLALELYAQNQKVASEKSCLETERLYPNTYGANRCKSLLRVITHSEFSIRFDNTESSKRNRLAVIEARNTSLLHFRLVSQDSLPKYQKWPTDTLLTITPTAKWDQELPDSGDHQEHKYLVPLPAIEQGDYYLVVYTDKGLCYLNYVSSDATFITYSIPRSAKRWTELSHSAGHIVDRITGMPMKGYRVTLEGWGAITSKSYHRRCRTDKEGFFQFPISSVSYNLIDYEKLSVNIDGYKHYFFNKYSYSPVQINEKSYDWRIDPSIQIRLVMTDRPVYRLGDTVHFCCEAFHQRIKGSDWKVKVRPARNLNVTATFGRDYNKALDTLHMTTDQHGRCWGWFVIPPDEENGIYNIALSTPKSDYRESHSIKVEAYRPPHFTASLSAAKESVDTVSVRHMGQPITIYGMAMSYSGAPMTDAKVQWKVAREKLNNPLQYFSAAKEYPFRDSLTVNDDGTFSFSFTPLPSEGDTDRKATYVFTAYAIVTDADGETHDCRLSLHVSNANGYCLLTGEDLSHLTYIYNNFDHQPLNGAVHITVQQLQQPEILRPLDTMMAMYPDAQWVGSEGDFRRLFPHLAFTREESLPHYWPIVDTLLDTTTTERSINLYNLPSSMYRIHFIMPDGTQHDTVVNHVAKDGIVTGTNIVWMRTTPKHQEDYRQSITCNVGDTIRIEMGSSYGNQPIFYNITHVGKIYKRDMMILDRNISILEIPITKKMKDGCVVSFAAVRDGHYFVRRYHIDVLRPERQLLIHTETFRDNLQPGATEQWKLRLAHNDSTNAEANLCLTMYDKSLEQYNHLNYGFWPFFRYRVRDMWTSFDYSDIVQERFSKTNPALISYYDNNKPQLGYSFRSMSDRSQKIGDGSLIGTITDEKTNEPLIAVNIVLKLDGKIVTGARTDFDGNFKIVSVPPGNYDIEVSYMGYNTAKCNITIRKTGYSVCNMRLGASGAILKEVVIKAAKIPDYEIGAPESGMRLSSNDIARMPSNSVDEIVAAVAGVGYARGEDGMVTQTGNVRQRLGIQAPKSAIAEIAYSFDFEGTSSEAPVNLRKNLSTLAFFMPALRSEKDGSITINFTLPDALTQWQLIGFAWTDKYAIGNINRIIQTQKELMIQPQLPRFMRQGDTIELRAKVSNLSDSAMMVQVTFNLYDSSHSLANIIQHRIIPIEPHTSKITSIRLPVHNNWVTANYKVQAHNLSNNTHHSDGEQGVIPVLSMNERVTTSRMLYIAGDPHGKEHQRTYYIPIAKRQEGDSLSITFTATPLKYAIEALPHFKKHRMPGNIYLTNNIFIDHLSSLLPSDNEKEQTRHAEHAKEKLYKLLRAQHRQGGWSWMPNGRKANLYVTEVVMQRIKQCSTPNRYYESYYRKAVDYLDRNIVELYNKIDSLSEPYLPFSTLYTRSLYMDVKPFDICDSITQKAYRYYHLLCRMRSMNPNLNLRCKCQLALMLQRMGDTADAVRLATLIKESAHTNDSMGMYWISNSFKPSESINLRPIEDASFAVDVMADVLHDWGSVNRIQQWILSYRQGTTWRTDMATASAISALIRTPDTANAQSMGNVTLTVNGTAINDSTQLSSSICQPLDTKASKLNITLKSTSRFPAWGALFYSHNTPVDSVRYSGTGIKLRKTMSVVNHDGSLSVVGDSTVLRVGDRVRLHIDIYCSRDLDNMVLRDQRAAGLEPVSTKSGWQYNDGLSYYVDVRDDSFDCYIDRLDEGHYYVEYDLWVRHSGVFASGISSLYSAYAPEFRAIAPSLKLNISNN